MKCHYWMFNTYNIRETIDSFARGPYYHLFKRYVFILLTKMRTETKTVPSTWYIFNFQGCTHTDYFSLCALYCYWLSTWGTSEFLYGKAKSCFRDWPFVCFSSVLISHVFGDYANTHTNKKDTVCLWWPLPNDLCPSYRQTTQPLCQFSSRLTHKFSLSHNCPKIRENLSKSLESSHKLNSTVHIFNKSKKQT